MSSDNFGERKQRMNRKYPRVSTSNLLYFEFVDTDGQSKIQSHGKTVSLSEGGMLFQADRVIANGTEIDIQFTLSEHLISAKGEVIYHLTKSGDHYDIGVRFTEIDDDNKIFIREKATGIFPLFKS
ncbi:PilZ domain-containing protein [candidate division CSSED10-310 bacterium]|uniref:PilZ domain-containing protein n=1 Tax=candidate division CSSED10-310 bacterium TaxID=2855610 RepID=A0ABV6Z6L9_UNCC1